MGVQQSKEARHEQNPDAAHLGVSERGKYASTPHALGKVDEKFPQQQLGRLPLKADLSAAQKAGLTHNSNSSSCPSILGVFESSQNADGRTPETAITIDSDNEEDLGTLPRKNQEHDVSRDCSDSEDDLVTLLRKHRKRHATENIHRVTRQDGWKSLDIDCWRRSGIHEDKTRRIKNNTSRCKDRKHQRQIDAEHRDNARRPEPWTQSFCPNKEGRNTISSLTNSLSSSSKNNRKRPCLHDGEHRLDAYKTNSLTENHRPTKKSRIAPQITDGLAIPSDSQIRYSEAGDGEHRFDIQKVKHETADFQPDKKNGKTPFQVNHSPRFHSNIASSSSKSLRGENSISRIDGSEKYGANNQTTKPQTKSPHVAEKSKLARFRQANRNVEAHPDTVSEPDTPEEYQKGKYVTAKVDSGELLRNTRPLIVSEPRVHQPDRSNATNRSRNINQRFRHPALNHYTFDDALHKHDQPSCPRTQSEERSAALIQKFESRQRAREYVVPELKWGYTIKYVDSADIILDEEDMKEKTKTGRSFADRQKANEYLYKETSPEVVGGLEAIASRTTTLEGPERLLKVDITLTNGEHYLQWVKRDLVVLNDIKDKRKQRKWKPTPRPKIPHYVVECDLLTYETSLVTRCEDDEDAMSLDDRDTGLGDLGLNIKLTTEKLKRKSFSIREMANDYAAKMFLENTRVTKLFAESSDVHWWRHNALPEHKKAMSDACRLDGLYGLEMDAHDMNSRLGWDQITVHVNEVDDISGPVNF
ncbi:hypothetical protein F4782DRAFT_498935 [Xylaria castorea]|nr:hypothetical protein F4782DRAFT_498935 [Xylaria castorea]